jgi:hypothetical protein
MHEQARSCIKIENDNTRGPLALATAILKWTIQVWIKRSSDWILGQNPCMLSNNIC